MGGWSTIKTILETYSNSDDPLDAIDDGLSTVNSTYSVSSAYEGHCAYNAFPQDFYDSAPDYLSQPDPEWADYYIWKKNYRSMFIFAQ